MEIKTNIDLKPNLQRYLSKIEEGCMFYGEHGMRHPSGLYNVSVGKVEGAITDFLEVLAEYKDKDFETVDKDNTGKLLKTYRSVLLSFREHLDDCFSVVKIFIKPSERQKDNRNQCRWLELNAKETTQELFDEIREYKNYLDRSVNELKHNSGILAGIAFYDDRDGTKNCLGYFIANVVEGSYDPVESIHPKLGDMYTGFSFRRDLHYNLFNMYKVSEDILEFLQQKIGVDIGSIEVEVKSAPDNLRKAFQQIMDMPRYHFPDEYVKPVPSVALTKDHRLKLTYPANLSIMPNRLNRVVLTHSTDGHTGAYRIPYM